MRTKNPTIYTTRTEGNGCTFKQCRVSVKSNNLDYWNYEFSIRHSAQSKHLRSPTMLRCDNPLADITQFIRRNIDTARMRPLGQPAKLPREKTSALQGTDLIKHPGKQASQLRHLTDFLIDLFQLLPQQFGSFVST